MGTVCQAGLRTGPEMRMKQTGKCDLPRYSSVLGLVATHKSCLLLSWFMVSLETLDGNITS